LYFLLQRVYLLLQPGRAATPILHTSGVLMLPTIHTHTQLSCKREIPLLIHQPRLFVVRILLQAPHTLAEGGGGGYSGVALQLRCFAFPRQGRQFS
jgi:hypothetical protein